MPAFNFHNAINSENYELNFNSAGMNADYMNLSLGQQWNSMEFNLQIKKPKKRERKNCLSKVKLN